MITRSVSVVSVGAGNLGSIVGWCRAAGVEPDVTNDSGRISDSDLVILPGSGHASSFFANLERQNLVAALQKRHVLGKAILGLCLGGQAMFDFSEEGQTQLLSLIPGTVVRNESGQTYTGWSSIRVESDAAPEILPSGPFYFNHGYSMFPEQSPGVQYWTASTTGATALVQHEASIACQFHPELSGEQGLELLRRTLSQVNS